MKIVLKKDVAHVGRKGEVVEVANGYGINFLIPNGMAYKSDSPQGKLLLEKVESGAVSKEKETIVTTEKLDSLTGQDFNLEVEANESGVLFAALNESKIAEMISALTKTEISKTNITLNDGPIKEVGEYTITLMNKKDVVGDAKVKVTSSK